MVAMISPFEGTLRGYRDLPAIEALESFHRLLTLVQPGQPLRCTVDDLSYPLIVTLVDELAEVVARDHGTIRYLDGHGSYQLGVSCGSIRGKDMPASAGSATVH